LVQSVSHLDFNAPVKTLCVMDSVSRANGGIFEAERRLQQTLHMETGLSVEVVGLQDSYTESDLPFWSPLVPKTWEVKGPRSFGFAPGFADSLLQAEADLAYCAGLWKYPSAAALHWTRQSGKPMMVAPHGMLEPWALANSGIKKRLAGWLFQKAQLMEASCLRALCPAEAASMRAYGLKNPICIIPNGIDLPTCVVGSGHDAAYVPFSSGRKVLLYLGRLHPKKGLANLIVAWSRVHGIHGKEWMLAIAGWDQGGHEAELKQQATELGIRWKDATSQGSGDASIIFLGPQFGEAKAEIYSRCDGFILPSLSEGLPMVVLEAWAHGKPVLMTPECNLPEGFAAHAALRVESTVESITEGLRQLFAMSPADLQTMGRQGRTLVENRFVWQKLAVQMASVYEWMLGGGPKPNCVESV
jgi:glycosyltransferase involved in cell wall biosynthesis